MTGGKAGRTGLETETGATVTGGGAGVRGGTGIDTGMTGHAVVEGAEIGTEGTATAIAIGAGTEASRMIIDGGDGTAGVVLLDTHCKMIEKHVACFVFHHLLHYSLVHCIFLLSSYTDPQECCLQVHRTDLLDAAPSTPDHHVYSDQIRNPKPFCPFHPIPFS